MYKKILFLFIPISMFTQSNANYWHNKNLANYAVTIVPIADLVTEPIINNKKENANAYEELPLLWNTNNSECLREHQLLFNDVVEVIEERGEEFLCKVPGIYYYNKNGQKDNTYWTHKKNLIFLKELKTRNEFNLTAIPALYTEDYKTVLLDNILTLCLPVKDEETGIGYSAATRFVRISQEDSDIAYAVKLMDYQSGTDASGKVKKLMIPKDNAVVNYWKNDFVKILKMWAPLFHSSASQPLIPYLWGGASFITISKPADFSLNEKVMNGKKVSVWERPNPRPYSGMDCSNLPLTAARVCGMPFFMKNTQTAIRDLKSFDDTDKFEDGDLIWYPVHIMVVSSVKDNEIIEARGYPWGYGTIHAIKVSEFFENVKNFDELLEAYKKQTPLRILNKEGKVCKEAKELKLLKLQKR
jgi:hypothetical protein